MKITNVFGLPDVLVRAVVMDPYDPGKCDITVTKLISPPRKVTLEAQHAKDLTEDVTDRLWSLLGQGIHTVLERAESDALTEKRLAITRQGWVISGQLDRFCMAAGLLQEIKVSSVFAVKEGGRQEWEAQLNILAHLLREHGHIVKDLQVIVILRDWKRSFADRAQDYPVSPVMTMSIPLWTEEKCEEFLDSRIRLHQAARNGNLPDCSAEERWATLDTWALMKDGRKTAIRLFDTESDAQAALQAVGPKHFLELRPGRDIRCESYCPCSPFCNQYQDKQKTAASAFESGDQSG